MAKYWVKIGEKVGGPYSPEKLRQLASIGKLKPTHLVSPDEEKWVRADKISGLSFSLKNGSPKAKIAAQGGQNSDGLPISKTLNTRLKRTSESIAVARLSVKEDKTPSVTTEKESYLQLLTTNGEPEKTEVRNVRAKLINGELTRHHQTRWIEPKPLKSDYKDEDDPDNELAKEEYRAAIKEWKVRRKWRPIGEGLVKDSYRIQLLYSPAKVLMQAGIFSVGGLLFVAVLIMSVVMLFQALTQPGAMEKLDESASMFKTAMMLLVVTAVVPALRPVFFTAAGSIFILPTLVGFIGGFLIGAPIGWLIGVCIGPFLPKPPSDGYVEQTKDPA